MASSWWFACGVHTTISQVSSTGRITTLPSA